MEHFTPFDDAMIGLIYSNKSKENSIMTKVFRSNDEWLSLITACRSSGLSDRDWCRNNGIAPSSFYNAISRLRNEACAVTAVPHEKLPAVQEAVEINLADFETTTITSRDSGCSKESSTAVRVNVGGISLEITNDAERSVIHETLRTLLGLC